METSAPSWDSLSSAPPASSVPAPKWDELSDEKPQSQISKGLSKLVDVASGIYGKTQDEYKALVQKGWDNLTPSERITALEFNALKSIKESLIPATGEAVIRTAPAAIGQTLGRISRVPGAQQVLGGLGGIIGEYAYDETTGQKPTLGGMTRAAITGGTTFPSGPVTPRQVLTQAGANVAGTTAQKVIDKGELPTAQEVAVSGLAGAASVPVAKLLESPAKLTRANEKMIQNSVRDATLAEARAAGYVIPASKINPTVVNEMLEGLAGKAETAQEALVRNQEVTNALARKAAGLPASAPITETALKAVRQESGKAYERIGSISNEAAADLEALKKARHDSSQYRRKYDTSKDPVDLEKADGFKKEANRLEDRLELHAEAQLDPKLKSAISDYDAAMARANRASSYMANLGGKREWLTELTPNTTDMGNNPQYGWQFRVTAADYQKAMADAEKAQANIAALRPKQTLPIIQDLRAARKQIAQTYEVQNALNLATGDVSAPYIGRSFDRGAPLTGELATIGKFQQAFPGIAREVSSAAGPGAESLFSFIRGGGRSALLSSPYQRMMGTPSYIPAPSLASNIARFSTMNATPYLNKYLQNQP